MKRDKRIGGSMRPGAIVAATLLLGVVLALVMFVARESMLENELLHARRRSDIVKIMGVPSLIVPRHETGMLFRPPPDCEAFESVLVYNRGNFRASVLVYVSADGHVACVAKRGLFTVGTRW